MKVGPKIVDEGLVFCDTPFFAVTPFELLGFVVDDPFIVEASSSE